MPNGVVADPCDCDLPPAALIAMKPDGNIHMPAVLRSFLERPGQLPSVARLTAHTAVALGKLRSARPKMDAFLSLALRDAPSSGGCQRDGQMFKIVELIQAGEDETSHRILPLQFPTRAAAIEHVELLQAQFLHRGWDKAPEQWWARNDASFSSIGG